MTTDYGLTVSRTLQPDNRSFDTIIWQHGKPVMDADWNLHFDIMSNRLQNYIKSNYQSGFYKVDLFTFDPLNVSYSNMFVMSDDVAIVNGCQVNVSPVFNNTHNSIILPAASSSERYDFVFLEVWKTIISGGTTTHKPSSAGIYKDGNVQNTIVSEILPDDIIDPALLPTPGESTKRVQIQYRIRIQQNVTVPNKQRTNIFDSQTFGQGAAISPIGSFLYTNMGAAIGDYGLWRAGNGDFASRTQLQTIDGYTYAIPIALIFRRNTIAYNDETNQFGSGIAIGGVSDRPDGLFYNSVDETDVIDLRHLVLSRDYSANEILKTAVNDLLMGKNKVRERELLQYDAISNTSITNYSVISVCDRIRSAWSDDTSNADIDKYTSYFSGIKVFRLNIGDMDSSQDFYRVSGVGNWTAGNTIRVKAPHGSPVGTVIQSTSVAVYFQNIIGGGLVTVQGAWAGLDTAAATFTLGINASLTNQELWIQFDVLYPQNYGLTYSPDQLLKLNYINASSYPTVSAAYFPHTGVLRMPNIAGEVDLLNKSIQLTSRHTKQLDFSHMGNSTVFTPPFYLSNYNVDNRSKTINIHPLISSTTTIDGTTRTISANNYDAATRLVCLPFRRNHVWFIRGIYDAASGGNEVATTLPAAEHPSAIVSNVFVHPTSGYSFAKITSVLDPTSIELLYGSGGSYVPVFRQTSGGHVNQFILVHYTTGTQYIATGIASQYNITHRSILTSDVSVYNDYNSDDSDPTTNTIKLRSGTGVVTGQTLYLDLDYIGVPHNGALIKMIYKYLPYQGFVELVQLQGVLKSMMGFIHTDGTGGTEYSQIGIDAIKYPRSIISYLPTPLGFESSVKRADVQGQYDPDAGVILGATGDIPVCYSFRKVFDASEIGVATPLTEGDIVTAIYNPGSYSVERGGNQATTAKAAMLQQMLYGLFGPTDLKQAVIFGLATANFGLQNELVLYVWTLTTHDLNNNFVPSNDTFYPTNAVSIAVDFFFINKRPLIKS